MILNVIIALFSLVALIILHELGHFLTARKFNIKIDEFGVGYPPRLFGKKIGETVYSINLLLLGGFVKIHGEDGQESGPRSFSRKPIWQRALVLAGGVVVFWIAAVIIFSIVAGLGMPMVVDDMDSTGLTNPQVEIVSVASNSPAEMAGIKAGDVIKQLEVGESVFLIHGVKDVQSFTEDYKGQNITITIIRGEEVIKTELAPRVSPPTGEGAIGIGLIRTAIKHYNWYQAPVEGVVITGQFTVAITTGLFQALVKAVKREPTGAEVRGPIGIIDLFQQSAQLGVSYFLYFLAMLSTYLAIFNLIPIPALDGGKLLFLGIEKLRGKPIKQATEQRINAVFFLLLIALMIFVTIKDVARLL